MEETGTGIKSKKGRVEITVRDFYSDKINSENYAEFSGKIRRKLNRRKREEKQTTSLILDFQEVSGFSSTAIGAIIAIYKALKSNNEKANMEIAGLSENDKGMLHIFNLHALFKIT